MEIDNTTIIILSVGFIIVWMLFKRLGRKPQRDDSTNGVRAGTGARGGSAGGAGSVGGAAGDQFDLERWFSRAQDVIGVMERDERATREGEWRELSIERQTALADEFLERTLGAAEARKLTPEERMRVGWAFYLSRLER